MGLLTLSRIDVPAAPLLKTHLRGGRFSSDTLTAPAVRAEASGVVAERTCSCVFFSIAGAAAAPEPACNSVKQHIEHKLRRVLPLRRRVLCGRSANIENTFKLGEFYTLTAPVVKAEAPGVVGERAGFFPLSLVPEAATAPEHACKIVNHHIEQTVRAS